MAKTTTRHAKNMTGTEVPNGMLQYMQIRDPASSVDSYVEYLDLHALWVTAGSDPSLEPRAIPHAAVSDRANPSFDERIFFSTRFLVASSNSKSLSKHPAEWAQLNATNFPSVNIPMVRQAIVAIFDAQRTFEGLDPEA